MKPETKRALELVAAGKTPYMAAKLMGIHQSTVSRALARQALNCWPIRGVRVDGDSVIVLAKGGNDAARWLCGEILALACPMCKGTGKE